MVRGGDATSRHVVRSILAGVQVGVDARSVASILDLVDLDEPSRHAALDLSRHLGLETTEASSARRVLVIQGRGGRRPVIVGALVRIEKLASDAVSPIPAFLSKVSERAGLSAVFRFGEEMGYIIDAERLLEQGAREGVE
jgi:hypothetical protein